MAKDAKIGSLIGLVLIFIIAFVINGFTRSGRTANRSGPSSARADNTLNIDWGLNPEIIIVPIDFFSFVAMTKILVDSRTKRLLIEKGKIDENLRYLNFQHLSNPLHSIKFSV